MDLASRILEAKDLTNKAVEAIPEWGVAAGEIFIKGFSGRDRSDWEAARDAFAKAKKEAGSETTEYEFRALFLTLALIGADGKRIFKDGDVAKLQEKNAATIERLFFIAFGYNGFVSEGEAEKNSESETNSDSGSNSPTNSDAQ
jgi:hypothetical protein